MKQLFTAVSIWLSAGLCYAQTNEMNLQKYWKLRSDLVERFVKIGSEDGESLPARCLNPKVCIDNAGGGGLGEMKWGDGMIRHGYYLGFLATEYRLLKDAGKDVTGIRNELYYALNAFNRVDRKAEFELAPIYNSYYPENLNGYYMREDIPDYFADLYWSNTTLQASCVNSPHFETNNKDRIHDLPHGYWAYGNSHQNVPSHDQLSSLMLGFSLVHKLVDNDFVQPTPSDQGFYLITETQGIVNRIMTYLNNHNWMMIDVNGWPVNNGGGDAILTAYPLSVIANRITGIDYTASINRTIASFILNSVQTCLVGYGSDDELSQEEACEDVLSHWTPLISDAYDDLVTGVPAGNLNNQDHSVYQTWLANGDINVHYDFTSNLWNNAIPDLLQDYEDDHQLSALPFPLNTIEWDFIDDGGINDDNNFNIIANYGVAAGIWDEQTIAAFTAITGNKQLELINKILRDEPPSQSPDAYKGYLDAMPSYGPFNLTGKSHDGLQLSSSAEYGWASEHRWTWTSVQDGGINTGSEGIFNGLDYLEFHNLYYLLYKNQLPTFDVQSDCFCETAPLYDGTTTTVSEIEAKTALNAKIPAVSYCVENTFTPVSNTISGTFNIEPYFPYYNDLGIHTTEFQTEDAAITGTGDVNVKTYFKICNAKTLTIQNGGRLDVEKTRINMGWNAKINNSGTILVKSGTELNVGPLASLILRSSSVLTIEDNATVYIDASAGLLYYNGATINMMGANSKLFIRGNIKVMDAGDFHIQQLGSQNGKIIFDGPSAGLLAANTNATFSFTGYGKGVELVKVTAGSKLWVFNDQAAKTTFTNCLVALDEGGRILSEQPCYASNTTFYSQVNNGGLTLTEGSRFSSVDFINVPVYASMNMENKGVMEAYTSLFKCESTAYSAPTLVTVTGRGCIFGSCDFYTPKEKAIDLSVLTLASTIGGGNIGYLGTIPSSSQLIGINDVSTVELTVKGVTITNCNVGIDKKWGTLTLRCNTIAHNQDVNIRANSSSTLNMSATTLGGYNYLGKTLNNKNIEAVSAYALNLKDGYNFIDFCQNGNTITGFTNLYCTTCPSLDFTNNQWNTANSIPANTGTIISSGNVPYTILVAPVALNQACPSNPIPDNGDANAKSTIASSPFPMIYSSVDGDSLYMNELIYLACSKMSVYGDSLADDLEAIHRFHDVFEAQPDKTDSLTNTWLWFAYNQMKTSLESAFAMNLLNTSDNSTNFDPYTAQYVSALMYLTDSIIDANNYEQQFYHEINKAHLFRMLDRSDIGLNILEELEACGVDSTGQANLNFWKEEYLKDLVVQQLGTTALDSVITVDTTQFLNPALVINAYAFGAIIHDLENIEYPNCSFFLSKEMKQNRTANGIELFPNPATDKVTVELHSLKDGNGKLIVQQPDGKVLYSKQVDVINNVQLEINVGAWSRGIYTVSVVFPDGKTQTQRLVVR